MVLGIQEKESISEVLEILDYMEEEYKNKLPPKFLKFLQENKDIRKYFISLYFFLCKSYELNCILYLRNKAFYIKRIECK